MTIDEPNSESLEQRHQFARRVVAGVAILLIAATKPLWFSKGEFPQVPFFEFLCPVPQWCDWALSGCLLLSLLVMLITKASSRKNLTAGAVSIGCLVILIALNQHRLQPWAWFLILATLATSADAQSSLRWMRWLIFGVYFFSGLSKAEPTFVNGGGDWLLEGMLKPFGQAPWLFSVETRRLLLYIMPVTEIAAAVCVIVPRLRFVGFFLAIAMHGALLFGLGPMGLNHKPGVLLWNLEFQLLAFPLLWKVQSQSSHPLPRSSRILGSAVIFGAIVLPCFGQRWFPIIDQWPSWSVYSTWAQEEKPIDVVIRIDSSAKLPNGIPLGQFSYFDYHRLDLDSWSLRATGAPIYPARRFRFGTAYGLVQLTGLSHGFISLDGFERADPGAGIQICNASGRSISEAAAVFRLNTKPRAAVRWILREPPEPEYLQ